MYRLNSRHPFWQAIIMVCEWNNLEFLYLGRSEALITFIAQTDETQPAADIISEIENDLRLMIHWNINFP